MRFHPLWAAIAGTFVIAAIPTLVKDADHRSGKSGKAEQSQQVANAAQAQVADSNAANNQTTAQLSQEDQGSNANSDKESGSAATWTNWIQAISAVAVAVFTYFLWRLQSRQTGLTENALEHTANATTASVGATAEMKKANEIAEDTAKRELRAYVGFPSMHLLDRHGDDPRWEIMIQNYGQTPAGHVTVRCVLYAEPPGAPHPPFNMLHQFGTMEPGRSQTLIVGFSPENFKIWGEKLTSGAVCMHMWGMLTYDDIYGRAYFKDFTAHISHRRINNTGGPIGASVIVGDEHEGYPDFQYEHGLAPA